MTSEVAQEGEVVGARIISRVLADGHAFAEAVAEDAGKDLTGDAGKDVAGDAGKDLARDTGKDVAGGGAGDAGGLSEPIPPPQEGQHVWRVWGQNQDAQGHMMPSGSRPWGESWTPADPTGSPDFRADAGLPNQNPGRFYTHGILTDPEHVYDVRPALPLDGQPGGWPEYLIRDPENAVEPLDIGGINEPWTHGPGGWEPPPPPPGEGS